MASMCIQNIVFDLHSFGILFIVFDLVVFYPISIPSPSPDLATATATATATAPASTAALAHATWLRHAPHSTYVAAHVLASSA